VNRHKAPLFDVQPSRSVLPNLRGTCAHARPKGIHQWSRRALSPEWASRSDRATAMRIRGHHADADASRDDLLHHHEQEEGELAHAS
jgi:hypothetical protein